MTFNLSAIPVRTIHLADLENSYDICNQMKDITAYCYSISCPAGVMKFGQSCDKSHLVNTNWGDRIYRQISRIPGWEDSTLGPNTFGYEFSDVVQHYPGLTKDQVIVTVWNMSKFPFAAINNPEYELTLLENQLIESYKALAGRAPIGNKDTESYIKNQSIVADSTIVSLLGANISAPKSKTIGKQKYKVDPKTFEEIFK